MMSKPEIVRRSDLSSLTCVSWRQMTSMLAALTTWWLLVSKLTTWRLLVNFTNHVMTTGQQTDHVTTTGQLVLLASITMDVQLSVHDVSVADWQLMYRRLQTLNSVQHTNLSVAADDVTAGDRMMRVWPCTSIHSRQTQWTRGMTQQRDHHSQWLLW